MDPEQGALDTFHMHNNIHPTLCGVFLCQQYYL
jgi:hypothetical protein